MKKNIYLLVLLGLMVFLFTACLPGDGTADSEHPANFLWGIWHGWLAPLSLILHFFRDHIRIYEIYNTGWWYDFGFYIAIIGGFGGISLSRRKRRKNRRDDD